MNSMLERHEIITIVMTGMNFNPVFFSFFFKKKDKLCSVFGVIYSFTNFFFFLIFWNGTIKKNIKKVSN